MELYQGLWKDVGGACCLRWSSPCRHGFWASSSRSWEARSSPSSWAWCSPCWCRPRRASRSLPASSSRPRRCFSTPSFCWAFGLNLAQIAQVGMTSLPIIVSTIATSLVVSFVLCRALTHPGKDLHAHWRGILHLRWVGHRGHGARDRGGRRGDRPGHQRDLPLQRDRRARVPPRSAGRWGSRTRASGSLQAPAVNDTSSVTAAAAALGRHAPRRQHARLRHHREAHAHAGHHPHHAGAGVLAGASGPPRGRGGQEHLQPASRLSVLHRVLCAGERRDHCLCAACCRDRPPSRSSPSSSSSWPWRRSASTPTS